MTGKIKKISLLLMIVVLLFLIVGCSSDLQSDYEAFSETTSENFTSENGENGKIRTDIDVLKVRSHYDFYELTFKNEDVTYYGVADASGKIFYYTESVPIDNSDFMSKAYMRKMGEDCCYVKKVSELETTYTVIKTNGNEKTFTKGVDFDELIGAGGGYILVYKNTGNASKSEYSYGLINSAGEWEMQLTPGPQISKLTTYGQATFDYIGEKVFVQEDFGECIVFDCAKNLTMGFHNCSFDYAGVNNGQFLVHTEYNYGEPTYSAPYGSEAKPLHADSYYLFSTDGTNKQISNIKYSFEKIAVYEEDGYLQIWNLENDNVAQYDDFPAESVAGVSFVGHTGLVRINGLDGKNYFTVIDAKGEQKFEPKIYYDFSYNFNGLFSEERIIFSTENGYKIMYDNKGNLIIPEESKYTSLHMNGDFVIGEYMKDGSGSDKVKVCLDKNGNEITFCLSE